MKRAAQLTAVLGALVLSAGIATFAAPAASASVRPAISNVACDESNDFNYFTFYISGAGPVCYEGSGTTTMYQGPVSFWYSEQNSGMFTYQTDTICPPPVVFAPNETGMLPPNSTVTSLTIY